MPKAAIEHDPKIDIALVAYGGSTAQCAKRATSFSHGLTANYMRLRSFPFGDDVEKSSRHWLIFVIEQNRDAQMRSLLALETRVEKHKLRSLLHYNGLPILRVHSPACSVKSNQDPQAQSFQCPPRKPPEVPYDLPAETESRHPSLPKNGLGLTRRDYEGGLRCARLRHDSITAAWSKPPVRNRTAKHGDSPASAAQPRRRPIL